MGKVYGKSKAIIETKLKDLESARLSSFVTNFFLAFLLLCFLYGDVEDKTLASWFIFFNSVLLVRIIIVSTQDKYINSADIDKRLNVFRLGILLGGISWGFGAYFLYPDNSTISSFYLMFIVMGVSAGSLMIHSVDFTSAVIYPITAITPYMLKLLQSEDDAAALLFSTSLVYLMFLVANAKKIALERESAITLNYDLRQNEQAMAVNEERYRLLLNYSPIGIVYYDKNLVASYYNQRFLDIVGLTNDILDGKMNAKLIRDKRPLRSVKTAIGGQIAEYNGWYDMTYSQNRLWLHMVSSPVFDANGEIVGGVSILQDMTQQKIAEDEVKKLAFYDPLTHLPNRRLFMDRLNHTLHMHKRDGEYGALMFLDLDRFKSLNDTLGHDYGDLLLKGVAERLVECVRKSDTVARFGGDEFVVLLDGFKHSIMTTKQEAQKVAEKILKELNKPFYLQGHTYRTSPSIGVVVFGGGEENQDNLLKYADIAMYQAKRSGRNIACFFDPSMQDEIFERVEMESQLLSALENREFVLFYQQQVNEEGKIIGLESLIRWNHPQKGIVSPAAFIEIAEETGLIIDIGIQVLHVAFAQMRAWQSHPILKDVEVSINVSAMQFKQENFANELFALILEYGIETKLLKIELTEGTLLECSDETVQSMLKIQEAGIRFSLDDFGIGYSSLHYLKKLPIDQLKIDQTFVRDIMHDASDRAIVRTIIAVAESLEFDLIAEGVETIEQKEMLESLGCKNFQGYLFHRPSAAQELEKELDSYMKL